MEICDDEEILDAQIYERFGSKSQNSAQILSLPKPYPSGMIMSAGALNQMLHHIFALLQPKREVLELYKLYITVNTSSYLLNGFRIQNFY